MPDEPPILTAVRSVAEAADPALTARVLADWLVDSTNYASAPLMDKLFPSWLGDLSARYSARHRTILERFLGWSLHRKALAPKGWKRAGLGSVLLDGVPLVAADVTAGRNAVPADPGDWLAELKTSLYSAGKLVAGLYHPLDTGTVRGWRFLLAPLAPASLPLVALPAHPWEIARAGCPGCGKVAVRYFGFEYTRYDRKYTADLIANTDPYLAKCCPHPVRVVQFPRGRRPDTLIRRPLPESAPPSLAPAKQQR